MYLHRVNLFHCVTHMYPVAFLPPTYHQFHQLIHTHTQSQGWIFGNLFKATSLRLGITILFGGEESVECPPPPPPPPTPTGSLTSGLLRRASRCCEAAGLSTSRAYLSYTSNSSASASSSKHGPAGDNGRKSRYNIWDNLKLKASFVSWTSFMEAQEKVNCSFWSQKNLIFFQAIFFPIFGHKTLDPDWIRIGIEPKMLDPDPYQQNPKTWSSRCSPGCQWGSWWSG